MMKFVKAILAVTFACLVCCSCGPKDPIKFKPTFSVTGRVLVDGQPTAGVEVRGMGVAGKVEGAPTSPVASSDAAGKFTMQTYKRDDGVSAGEYDLVFYWAGAAGRNPGSDPPDKLNNRYRTADKSPKKLIVTDGPVDLGDILLTTK
jgi:hypothetical protein